MIDILIDALAVFGLAVLCDVIVDRLRSHKRAKQLRLTRVEVLRVERRERDGRGG